jgi:TIR domain
MTLTAPYDVFLSHNRRQKAWVRSVVQLMRHHGLRVFFDEDDIRPGDDLVLAIERGVESSNVLVLVLSRSSVVSTWVALESSISVYRSLTSEQQRLIPVLVEPVDPKQIKPTVRKLVAVDLTDPTTRETEFLRLLRSLGVTNVQGSELPPWPESSGVRELYIVDLEDITGWQWTAEHLVEQLTALDYALFEGLTPELEGDVKQWMPVYLDHPDTWRLLVTPERELVGYWHFLPLFDADFECAMAGQLRDAEITTDRVRMFEFPGTYPLYFECIALLPIYRKTKAYAALMRSFFDVILEHAQNGIFFDRLGANAYTPSGVALCKSFGFRPLVPHVDRGRMYTGQMSEFLRLPSCASYAELRALYDAHFATARRDD